jgi:hypothetical protein
MSATPAPHTMIVAQLGFNGLGHDVTEPKLDIAYAQYQVSDAFKFNVGRVKQPFGEYTEFFDVGTAHNMLSLPHGVYDVSGMMGEVYNGVGFTGGVYSQNGWGLRYDGYAGDFNAATARPWQGLEETSRLFHELIGGRAIVDLPISGLSVGASAYTGHLDDTTDIGSGERHSVFAVQADWSFRSLTLRGEAMTQREPDIHENAAYVEGTFRLTGGWQLSGRVDHSLAGGPEPDAAPRPLSRHTDVAAGLNYWIAPNFVLRAEIHDITGNRFIEPHTASELGKRTRVVQFGSQFSF